MTTGEIILTIVITILVSITLVIISVVRAAAKSAENSNGDLIKIYKKLRSLEAVNKKQDEALTNQMEKIKNLYRTLNALIDELEKK